jgi:(p)ppGpp synthase/HD superfamily hydrolase
VATLERAIRIAVEAHTGQTEKSGEPYILHALRVMFAVPDIDARIVGVLHDVIEDTSVTEGDLRAAGFSEPILDAVRGLTRAGSERYVDYVVALQRNPLAVRVKLADLTDNSRLDRNVIFPDKFDADKRRISKYLATYKFLTDQIGETAYRMLMADLEGPPAVGSPVEAP